MLRLDARTKTYNAGAVVRLQLAQPRRGKGIAIGARTRSVSAISTTQQTALRAKAFAPVCWGATEGELA